VIPAAPAAIAGRPIGQVGIVVHDLDDALARYSRLWGIGPWNCWTMGPAIVTERGFGSGPGEYEMRVALCGEGPQVELVEPVRGPNVYDRWLAERGEGMHHVGIHVESIDASMDSMAAAGYEPLQWGKGYGAEGDGGFAYYDLLAELGLYLELIEKPATRHPPERVYP
jgi:methylmalonyl-CoA/ethylmalonyl-CoA epimerase